MQIIIKKGDSKRTIHRLLKNIPVGKGLDAFRYCGLIRLKIDPLQIQKQMRNEWK